MGDCDNPAQAYQERMRKAAKDHVCCECSNVIPKADYYCYISGVWDNRGESFHTCWPCVAFRNRDKRLNAGWRGYEAPYIGQLYEDYPREELPSHHPSYGVPA